MHFDGALTSHIYPFPLDAPNGASRDNSQGSVTVNVMSITQCVVSKMTIISDVKVPRSIRTLEYDLYDSERFVFWPGDGWPRKQGSILSTMHNTDVSPTP